MEFVAAGIGLFRLEQRPARTLQKSASRGRSLPFSGLGMKHDDRFHPIPFPTRQIGKMQHAIGFNDRFHENPVHTSSTTHVSERSIKQPNEHNCTFFRAVRKDDKMVVLAD
jgi:hypothetical protein